MLKCIHDEDSNDGSILWQSDVAGQPIEYQDLVLFPRNLKDVNRLVLLTVAIRLIRLSPV